MDGELKSMLEKVDGCPVTRKQKLKLFRAGVCPRLTWLLAIEEFPMSWVEKELDSLATNHLAERGLQRDLTLTRKKFKAGTVVQEVMMMDPDYTRKSLN